MLLFGTVRRFECNLCGVVVSEKPDSFCIPTSTTCECNESTVRKLWYCSIQCRDDDTWHICRDKEIWINRAERKFVQYSPIVRQLYESAKKRGDEYALFIRAKCHRQLDEIAIVFENNYGFELLIEKSDQKLADNSVILEPSYGPREFVVLNDHLTASSPEHSELEEVNIPDTGLVIAAHLNTQGEGPTFKVSDSLAYWMFRNTNRRHALPFLTQIAIRDDTYLIRLSFAHKFDIAQPFSTDELCIRIEKCANEIRDFTPIQVESCTENQNFAWTITGIGIVHIRVYGIIKKPTRPRWVGQVLRRLANVTAFNGAYVLIRDETDRYRDIFIREVSSI